MVEIEIYFSRNFTIYENQSIRPIFDLINFYKTCLERRENQSKCKWNNHAFSAAFYKQ